MTSGRSLSFFLLFVFMTWLSYSTDGIWYYSYPNPSTGKYVVEFEAYQPACIAFYGVSYPCITSSGLYYMKATFANDSSNSLVSFSGNFSAYCYNNSVNCFGLAEFGVGHNSTKDMAHGSQYNWFGCGNPSTNFIMPSAPASSQNCSSKASLLGHSGTWVEVAAGEEYDSPGLYYAPTDVLLQSFNGVNGKFCMKPSDFFLKNNYETLPAAFPNLVASCGITCSPGEKSCFVQGDTQGNLYVCSDAGQWILYQTCAQSSGYCFNGDSSKCPGYGTNYLISDRTGVPNRVSIIDNLDRALPYQEPTQVYPEGYYLLASGQEIKETSFGYVSSFNGKRWLFQASDSVFSNYTYNATETTCVSSVGGSNVSSDGFSWSDGDSLNCTLNAGYTSSNLTLTINSNLTNNGLQQVSNPQITKTFQVKLVSDVALLDNFQLIRLSDSLYAVSGHIIRYSDLGDIPEYQNPRASAYLYMNLNGVSGKIENVAQTNASAWYSTFSFAGGSGAGTFRYNFSVGADGYANDTEYYWSGLVSSQRLAYFKCRNIPNNFTFDFVSQHAGPTHLECRFLMANTSAVSMTDASAAYVSTNAGGRSDSCGVQTNVLSSRQVGYEVYFDLLQAYYSKCYGTGDYKPIAPGRYVESANYLTIPGGIAFAPTYTEYTIEQGLGSSFKFNPGYVQLNQSVYHQNESVQCNAEWYDDYNLTGGWEVTFSSSDHSYTLNDKTALGACSYGASSPECFFKNFACNGTAVSQGGTGQLCVLQVGFYGVQQCKNEGDKSCYSFKWPFIDSGTSGKLTCKLTLFKPEAYGGAVSQSDTSDLMLQKANAYDTSGWQWWLWLLIILGVLLLVAVIKSIFK